MPQAIFDAIDAHDVPWLERLLQQGADPDEVKSEWVRLRPLHAAIVALDDGGSLEALRVLIRHGADLNQTYPDIGGGTPLLVALFNDEADAADLLLEAGADPNVVGDEGDSPLRWAVEHRDQALAKRLLSKGAHRTIDGFGGWSGMTALGAAARHLDADMVGLLLEAGASRNQLDLDHGRAVDRLPAKTAGNAAEWDRVAAMVLPGA